MKFACRSDHDQTDLIELPEFINMASDQGHLTAEEITGDLNIEELPEEDSVMAQTVDDLNSLSFAEQEKVSEMT